MDPFVDFVVKTLKLDNFIRLGLFDQYDFLNVL